MGSTRGRGALRRHLPAVLILLVIGLGATAIRAVFIRGAHRLLDPWEHGVLPGSPVAAAGPRIPIAWPPRAEWRDLRWRFAAGGDLGCDRLEIQLQPLDVLRGRLRVGRVELDTLHLSGRSDLDEWASRLGAAASESADTAPLARPDRHAVRVTIGSLTAGSSSSGSLRVEGWSWSTGAGRWNFLARGRTPAGKSFDLNARGIESPARSERSGILSFASARTVQIDWTREEGKESILRVAVRDDGGLLGAVAGSLPIVGEISPRGAIDLTIERIGARPLEGDARIDNLQLSAQEDDPLRLRGLVCIEKGMAALEDFHVSSPRSDVIVEARFPLHPGVATTPFRVSGVLEGDPIEATGDLFFTADSVVVASERIHMGEAFAGPARITWIRPMRGPDRAGENAGRLEGVVSLGAGRVIVEQAPDLEKGAIRMRGKGVPLEGLAAWFPFKMHGDWSGLIDGTAVFRRMGGAWVGEGTAMAREGRVSGLDLLDEIGGLGGSGAVRFREARTHWSYASGRLLADSLAADAGRVKIAGTLFYSRPDSILGLLRISPDGASGFASILRLLGGNEGSLDLGLAGDPAHPEIQPLDAATIPRWRSDIDRVRRGFAAPGHERTAANGANGLHRR
jgi:hypothetical protein